MNRLSLKLNFAWTLVGQIAYAIAQWLIITLIARQGSPEQVGQYALAVAICTPVVTFASLRLRSIQASDSEDEYSFAQFLSLRLVAMGVAMLVIVTVAGISRGWSLPALTIILVGLSRCIDAISDIVHGFHQRHERLDRVSRAFVARGILSSLFFAIGFLFTGQLLGGVVGLVTSSLLVFALVDIRLFRRTYLEVSGAVGLAGGIGGWRDHVRANAWTVIPVGLFWTSLPLGFTSTISSLSTNVPRYFIEHAHGAEMLGIYAAMIYPLVAGSMLVSALAQSSMPRLSTYFRGGLLEPFKRLLVRLILLGAAIGVVGVIAATALGEWGLGILYGEEYAQHHHIFTWAMINAAIGYSYLFLGTALNAMRLFSVQLPIHMVSLIVLVISCSILVAPYGMEGAVWSLLIASLVELGMYGAIVVRKIRSVAAL